jgi:D-glycero-alpha-D-manno-heptose-7-phosphate kinase
MIITRTPVRISFGGGGTDIPGFYEEHGGAVVSITINKYFYSFYNPRDDEKIQMISSDFQSLLSVDDFYSLKFGEGFDIPSAVIKHFRLYHGFDLFTASEIPPGSGLGSSGAVTVNMVRLCSKLKNETMTQRQIAEDAFFIQRQILNLPIGKQDEYAAAYGGLNFIVFSEKEVSVNPIQIDPDTKKSLEKNLLLFFTKKTRQASTILQRQEDSIKGKDTSIIEAMIEVKNNAYSIKEALERGDLERFGRLLDEAWNSKKKMSPDISNHYLDNIYEIAMQNGALGGKIAGAGGGGYFMFYCEEEKQDDLRNAMEAEKLGFLDFNFSEKGVTILNNGNVM